jgi:DNA-binding NarL/FixJ family response regulator
MAHTALATRQVNLVVLDRFGSAAPSETGAPNDLIRVLVAHPHALVRAGLRALLEASHDIAVDGEASGAEDALALARRSRPDVVLIDAGSDGLDVAWRIVSDQALAAVRVLILGGRSSDESVTSVLGIGLGGHLHKDSEPTELRSAVRRLAARDRAQLMALAGTAGTDNASKERFAWNSGI